MRVRRARLWTRSCGNRACIARRRQLDSPRHTTAYRDRYVTAQILDTATGGAKFAVYYNSTGGSGAGAPNLRIATLLTHGAVRDYVLAGGAWLAAAPRARQAAVVGGAAVRRRWPRDDVQPDCAELFD